MRATAETLHDFYDTPLGRAAKAMILRRMDPLWPDLAGKNILGFGYCLPVLKAQDATANRLVYAMPDEQGALPVTGRRGIGSCLVEETKLPFSDASFDTVLCLHGLEESADPMRLLRELWRVTRPEGRILVVAAHRGGLWARSESVPFGRGRPYSRRQLRSALSQAGFHPTVWSGALYIPPTHILARPKLRDAVERFGETVWPGFSGLVLVEAMKRLYASTDNGQKEAVRRPVLGGQPIINRNSHPAPDHAQR